MSRTLLQPFNSISKDSIDLETKTSQSVAIASIKKNVSKSESRIPYQFFPNLKRFINRLVILPLTLPMCLVMVLGVGNVWGQTNNYFGTSGTISGSVWSTSVGGPYTSALATTGGPILNFNNAGSATGATIATCVGINFGASITWAAGGTIGAAGINLPINVSAGVNQNLTSNLSTAATAAYTKNGDGALQTSGGTYGGGFTLNAGAIIAGGVNAMGGNATPGLLTLNGGTVAANGNKAFTGKYSNIVIGGNIQFGEMSSVISLASSTSNLTFSNNMSLGSVNRTFTLGNDGNMGFGGVISNTGSNGLTFTANSNGTGRFDITGTNTFSGPVNINGNGTGVAEVRFTTDGSIGNAANTITIDGGRLAIVSNGTVTIANARNIAVGATSGTSISAPGTGTLTYNGVIADKPTTTGAWSKQGSGTLSLGGVSTYTGATSINNGTIQLTTGNDRLPTGTVLSLGQSASLNIGTLDLNGRNQTIAGLNSTTGSASALTNVGLNNTITSTAAATLTISGSGTYGAATDANSGIIAGAISLEKSGTGILTLGDVSTYTGTTTVSGGTLTLSGSGSIASSSSITVGSGGTFDVSGLTTALSLGASQSLKSSATGANTTATITVASSKGITLSAGGLQFTAYGGGATAPLTVTGASAGSLALANAPITITTTSELAAGTYKLIAKGGSVTAAVSGTIGTLTMGGSGLSTNTTGALSIVSGELILTVTATPTLTAATLASAISSTYGTASTGVSFTASGSNLTGNITATAQTGFAVSTTQGSGYTSSVSVASGTTVYVQSTATKAVSTFNTTTAVVLSGGGAASSVNITTSASGNAVTQKALTISSASATSKTYDRTNSATITGSLSGIVNSDVVTLSGTGTFAQSNIGTAISVTSTSTLGGAGAGNYSLTQPTGLTADIIAKALTVSGASVNNKTYDGTNTATVTGGSLIGIVSPDAVTLSQSGTFAQTTIGSTLSVTSTSTLGGADAGNYTLTQPTGLTANITAKALTVSGMTAADKTYDGTTTATLSGGSLVGIVSADVVTLTQTGTFSQSTVGSGLTVTSTSSLGGANAASYSLTQPSGITASITKATPVINSSPSASDITLGQALSSSTLTGGSATPSGGSFAFTSPSTVPGSTGSYSASVTYTPADVTNYNTVSSSTNVLVNAAVSPTINAVSLSSSLSSTYGTASTGISFTPSGSNLSENITVTAQSGFEVSTSLGSGYGASVSVASGSTVYVHFSASIAVGSYNNTVFAVLSSAGATNTDAITFSSSNSVSQKIVSISTASIASKTYNGSATSGTVTAGTLSGFVGSETVTISAVTGTYSDANVGTGKTATIVYSLANGSNGGLATNYSLANTSATGDITTKALSISVATIASKVYDASATSGTVTAGTLSGFVGSETVTVSAVTGIYADANVGIGKTATISYTLANGSNGGLATNYTLSNTSSTGNITAKSLSISAASIASKTYDASATSGTVTPGALSGFLGSETVSVSAAVGTYADGNAGTGKSATIVYTLADGANGGLATNYTLENTVGTGNITKLPLTITAADQSVAYATSVATVTGAGSYTASGFVNGETSSVIGGSATYSTTYTTTTAVGSIGVTITTIVSSLTATNYSFTAATGTVTVSIANQTITFAALPTKYTNSAAFASGASSSTPGTLSYSSSNTNIATIDASGTITIQGVAGSTTITVSQASTSNYNAATDATQLLTVNQAPIISATPSSLAAFTAASGTASTPQGFTVAGSNLLENITVTAPTGFEVSQTAGGGSGYAATQTLTQASGAVSITVYVRMTSSATGTPSGNVALTSTSASTVNVAVSGTVNNPNCLSQANFTAAPTSWLATSITYGSNEAIFASNTGELTTLEISNPTTLTFDLRRTNNTGAKSLLVEVSTTTQNGSYTTVATYDQSNTTSAGTTNCTVDLSAYSSDSTVFLKFRKSSSTNSPWYLKNVAVNCGAPTIIAGGGPLSSLSTTYGTSSSPTSFELTGSNLSTTISIAALSGFEFSATAGGAGAYTSTLSGISATGPTTIYVRLAASANVGTYSGNIVCSSGSTTLNVPMVSSTVSKANQTITFASTNTKTYGDADYAPGATSASSGAIPITYASSNTSVATIVSSQINIVGVGTSTITASQAGNANYNAAADVTQTLTVVKANQSITFAATNSKTYGDADYAPGATSATSGTNAITYSSSNTSVATIVAGQIHIVAPGTTTITASQAGNTNYNAAADATQTLTVNPKSLTITNLTANSKNEDGNTNATLTGTAALSGVISGDDVSLTGTAVGTFASAAVGVNINVTVSSLSLTGTSASNYSLTTLILTADIIANSPTLFSSGTLSAVNTTYGSASSSPSSFSVSAQSLTDPVTITAPSGFEVSTNISSGYSSSINVGTSGTLASTTIYVRLTDATTVAGSPYSGNIVLSSNGATSVNVATASSTVSQKNLTITGMTTANKVYDGTNSAIVTGGSLVGILGTDVVTLTQSGTFAQTSVGTIIAITSTSTIGGAASGNYILTQPSLTSRDITTKVLSITTATIASKVYDGFTTSGSVTAGTLSGFVGSETVVVSSATGTYSDANVGIGKTATITYTLGNGTNGGLATNYSLANTTATGDITQATQTISFSSFTTPITASTTIVASSNFGGTISYSSSNTGIATINSSTGVVTIVGNGTTTITASNAGNSNYTTASTSQVLTVNSSTVVTLLTWNTNGNAGTETTESSTSNTNVASSTLSLGAGVTAGSNSNRFGGSGWFKTGNTNPSLLSEAITANSYIEFTVTPTTGYSITPTSFEFIWDFSGSGPSSVALRSSADNYATNLGTVTGMTASTSLFKTLSIAGLSNITSATTFRLYGYAATATGGTGGFDCGSSQNNVLLKGTVSCTTPSQSSAISGTTTVCSGSAQTYSVTNVSGVGYTWSLPGSWSGSSTSNSITANVGSTEGTISVTPYNVASGCSNYTASSQSISVTVNTTPNAPTASTQSFCSSASPTVADLTATGTAIQWYDASTNGNLVASETALTSANYYASQTVSSCESATRTSVAVTVNANGTWIGDSNDDWNDANNWCGGIPNSNSIVVSIPSGVTVNLDTSPSVSELTIASTSVINAGSNTVTIANGGTFTNNGTFNAQTGTVAFSGTGTLAGNATTFNNLTTNGNLTASASPTINGTLTLSSGTLTVGANTLTLNGSISRTSGNIDASNASATVVFGGSTAQTIPASTFTGNVNNLTLNNSAGLTTSQSLTVANTLNLSSGVLTLGTNNLTLTGSLHASNNGSSTAFINTNSSGALIRSISSTGVDYKFPVGLSDYAPISVNFTGGTIASSTLASRAVSGLHPEAEDGDYIRSNLYWQMNQSGMTNPQYNVSFTYPGVTNGAGSSETEANLLPAKWSASTGWLSSGSCAVCFNGSTMGTSSINTGTKTLTWNGVSGFSDFGGFGEGNGSPLPVELLSFNASCLEDQNVLTWQTASENNSSYFDIEKSRDGETWNVIGQQAAAGNSNELLSYLFVDEEKNNATVYYRLNQNDMDGKNEYFGPVAVDCEENIFEANTLPNPSNGDFCIKIQSNETTSCTIKLVDIKGNILLTNDVYIQEGINLFQMNNLLESGMYFIHIQNASEQKVTTIKHLHH